MVKFSSQNIENQYSLIKVAVDNFTKNKKALDEIKKISHMCQRI